MKLTTMRLPALGLLAAMLLAACNLPVTPTPHPTATPVPPPVQSEPAPAQIGGACIVGTWQISNLSEYLQTSLPQVVEGATVKLGESSGSLFYTFHADGTTLGKAEDFKIKATVNTNGVNLPGQITVNGASQGKYQVNNDSGLLTLTDVQPGDLAVTASVAGIPVVNNTPITSLFTFGSNDTADGSANFECIGNTLKISVDLANIGPRVVILDRVSE